MNRTNWEHAGWALLMMLAVWIAAAPVTGWLLANPQYIPMAFGATVGTTWFVAREHTQAEGRYVRENSYRTLTETGYKVFTPKWPEFRCLTPEYWSLNDMLDWIFAALAVWTIGPALVNLLGA